MKTESETIVSTAVIYEKNKQLISGRGRLLLRVFRCTARCWDPIEGGCSSISEDRINFGDEVSANWQQLEE